MAIDYPQIPELAAAASALWHRRKDVGLSHGFVDYCMVLVERCRKLVTGAHLERDNSVFDLEADETAIERLDLVIDRCEAVTHTK
jgi:hypothetical protein